MTSILQARLDSESKALIEKAAKLRKVGMTDYVKLVLVPAAKREVDLAESSENVLALTKEEQITFWNALNEEPVELDEGLKTLANYKPDF